MIRHLIFLVGFAENAYGRFSRIVRGEFPSSIAKWIPYSSGFGIGHERFASNLVDTIRQALASEAGAGDSSHRFFLSLLIEKRVDVDEYIQVVVNDVTPYAFLVFIDSQPEPQIFGKLRLALVGVNRISARLLECTKDGAIRRAPFALPWMNYKNDQYQSECRAISHRRFNNIERAQSRLMSLLKLLESDRAQTGAFRDRRNLLFGPAVPAQWHAWDGRKVLLFEDFRLGCRVPRGFHYDVSADRNHISDYDLIDRRFGVVRADRGDAIANIYPSDIVRFKKT